MPMADNLASQQSTMAPNTDPRYSRYLCHVIANEAPAVLVRTDDVSLDLVGDLRRNEVLVNPYTICVCCFCGKRLLFEVAGTHMITDCYAAYMRYKTFIRATSRPPLIRMTTIDEEENEATLDRKEAASTARVKPVKVKAKNVSGASADTSSGKRGRPPKSGGRSLKSAGVGQADEAIIALVRTYLSARVGSLDTDDRECWPLFNKRFILGGT
jgi:hypothetical protein